MLKKQNISIKSLKDLNNYLVSFFNTTLPLNTNILESLFNALSIALKANIKFSFKGKDYFSKYRFKQNLKLNITDTHWDITEGHQIMIKSMEDQ